MGPGEINSADVATDASPRRIRTGHIPIPDARTDWRAFQGFSVTEAPASALAHLVELLEPLGLAPMDGALLLRHRSGGSGLPDLAREEDGGFALDLTDARRTIDGGLLLFVDEAGRAKGWRAEAGALTLWNGDDPVLTELAPGAADRITLFGRMRRL